VVLQPPYFSVFCCAICGITLLIAHFGLVDIFMGIFVAKFYLSGDNRRALWSLQHMLLLIACLFKANTFGTIGRIKFSKDPIVYNETSNYQWMVVTELGQCEIVFFEQGYQFFFQR
jgi:predicted membrane-bound spermidine synthase